MSSVSWRPRKRRSSVRDAQPLTTDSQVSWRIGSVHCISCAIGEWSLVFRRPRRSRYYSSADMSAASGAMCTDASTEVSASASRARSARSRRVAMRPERLPWTQTRLSASLPGRRRLLRTARGLDSGGDSGMSGPGRSRGQAKPACPPAWLFEWGPASQAMRVAILEMAQPSQSRWRSGRLVDRRSGGPGLEVKFAYRSLNRSDSPVERVRDPLGCRDCRRVPAALDLAEVLRVHPRDAVGNLIERLASSFAGLADRVAELA
jgi:hypothetical protein